MKVLSFNISSMNDTAVNSLYNSFIEGIKEEGGNVEIVETSEMDIHPCRGCTSDITFVSEGICYCQDDMQKLYPKFRDTKLWIFSYIYGLNGSLRRFRNILDRMEPLFEPEDFTSVNKIKHVIKGKVVFFAASESWALDALRPMENELRRMSSLFSREFAGSVLRPHSWALDALPRMGKNVDDIFNAAKNAGKELIREGYITKKVMDEISRILVAKDAFITQEAKNFNLSSSKV